MLANIQAESPYTLNAGYNLRPTLEISVLWRTDIINAGNSNIRVCQTPIMARNTFSTANLVTALSGSWGGFIPYSNDVVPAGYYNWPQSSIFENTAFWNIYKPGKPRTRLLKVGKTVSFVSRRSRVRINYEEMALVSANFTAADGLIKGKSSAFVYEFTGELSHVCQDGAGFSTIQESNGQFLIRSQARYVYRWVNYNRQSIYGSPQYAQAVVAGTSQVGVPMVKSYREQMTSAGGSTDITKRQSVNIQPSFGCLGVPFVPTVTAL